MALCSATASRSSSREAKCCPIERRATPASLRDLGRGGLDAALVEELGEGGNDGDARALGAFAASVEFGLGGCLVDHGDAVHVEPVAGVRYVQPSNAKRG